MNRIKCLFMIVIIILIANLFAGCTTNEEPEKEATYITDDTGVNVKVPNDIDKIISLAPSITEILFKLGVGEKIVGRDSGSNYPQETEDIEVVSTYEGIDIEKILYHDPDIILMDKTLDLSEENYEKLVEYDLCVFRVFPKELSNVFENIMVIGKIVQKESTAEQLVTTLEDRVEVVQECAQASEGSKPKVLHVIYYDGMSSPWVATTSTFSGDLIEIAGGVPAIDDNSGQSLQITVEQLIGLNPDIIFTSQDDNWPTPSRDAILNDPTLADINAVKNEQVIDINADIIDRTGPRLVDGLETISGHILS